jgi:hypothetical protein
MASLRRFDVQAKVALIISCAAFLGVIALIAVLGRNYNHGLRMIIYSPKSMFSPTIFVLTGMTFLLAGTGTVMGANSAGQRRNEKTKQSWAAFFVGAAAISFPIILFCGFWPFRSPL